MSEHRIIVHNRVTEEYFSDPAEASARATVLARDPNAEAIGAAVSRNHEWMSKDSTWYCIRWTETRPELEGS